MNDGTNGNGRGRREAALFSGDPLQAAPATPKSPSVPTMPDDEIAIEEGEPENTSAARADPTPPLDPEPLDHDVPPRKRETGRRVRGRMTLRIPDDEVSRPSSPSAPPPAPAPSTSSRDAFPPREPPSKVHDGPAVSTSRIITISSPPPPLDDSLAHEPSEAGPPSVSPTDSTREVPTATPLAPHTLEDLSDGTGVDSVRDAAPYGLGDADPFARTRETEHAPTTQPTPIAKHDHADAAEPRSGPVQSSPDIVIDEDIPEVAHSEPVPPPPESAEPLDVEEARLKSEPPPRSSEPGDLAEIAPEDFVSIESVPARPLAKPQAPPPPVSNKSLASSGANPAAKALGTTGPNPAAKALGATGPNPAAPHVSPSKPPAAAPAVPPPPPRPPLLLVPTLASPLAPPPMNEAAATRKRARPWWEELFNDDFIRTMAKISDAQIATEVDFIEESLGLAKGAVVLDLACGTGRHAIEMTSRGYQVVGFDLSLAMLARAADEAQERDQKLNFVQGDMREMTFEETFDGVYAWNTSFGFFEEEKNAVVISNLRRALKVGGLLLLDIANRDYLARQSPSLAWFEGDGCVCMDEMHIDWITSRMRVKRTMMLDDGRTKEIDYSIRVYSLHELGRVLHDNGFRVSEVSGRVATPGVFFGADSPRILVVAEKR
jgi:SAM-dependent methyltransferase